MNIRKKNIHLPLMNACLLSTFVTDLRNHHDVARRINYRNLSTSGASFSFEDIQKILQVFPLREYTDDTLDIFYRKLIAFFDQIFHNQGANL